MLSLPTVCTAATPIPAQAGMPGKQRHLHEASLEVLGTYFGVVAPSRDIEAVWAERSAGALPAETANTAAPSGI